LFDKAGSGPDRAGVTCALLKAVVFDFNAAPETPRHHRASGEG
jgi:hypothetical protein